METNKRIVKLIAKKLVSALSEEEQRELDEWLAGSEQNREFYEQFKDDVYLSKIISGQSIADTDASWKRYEKTYFPTVIAKRKYIVYRNVVAACIFIALCVGAFYLFQPNKVLSPNGTILKMSDGSVIVLENEGYGVLADLGSYKIIKEGDNAIKYSIAGNKSGSAILSYDTIITTTGSQWEVTMIDGTKIWINAKSSIIYPAGLNNQERKIKLNGEAYFEVNSIVDELSHKKVPFTVTASEMQVSVLGTHFSVMAYSNEPNKVASLYEGLVKVNGKDSMIELKPGQQAIMNSEGKLQVNTPSDLEDAIAWRNGEINFDGCPLDSIMRQASRWYDMEFRCESNCSKRFSTTLMKKDSLKTFLQSLESTGGVHFNIEGKKIIAR